MRAGVDVVDVKMQFCKLIYTMVMVIPPLFNHTIVYKVLETQNNVHHVHPFRNPCPK